MNVKLESILNAAVRDEVNDVLLRVGLPPTFRCDGALAQAPSVEPISAEVMAEMFDSIVPDKSYLELYQANKSIDFAFEFGEVRFRVNACQARGLSAITLRRLPSRVLAFEEIGLPEGFIELTKRPRGLLLVTGPTGSGKTTTLASVISAQLKGGGRHVYVIEQPTEYVFGHANGVLTQREVPTDCPSFSEALTDSLRANPDVIVVGEMRDLPTIRAALTAAETGHLVLATLHTSTASSTINRIIDVFPDMEKAQVRTQLAMSLLGVLCQQLLARAGYDGGQVAAFEFMRMTSAVANLIRDNRTNHIENAIQTGRNVGMQLLDDHLYELVVARKVEPQDGLLKANDPAALIAKLRQHPDAFDMGIIEDQMLGG